MKINSKMSDSGCYSDHFIESKVNTTTSHLMFKRNSLLTVNKSYSYKMETNI